MNTTDTLIEAIKLKKQITYCYNKPGKTQGKRIGNPYAIYNAHTINGSVNVNTHIIQTGGVSDSTDKNPLPSFRTHTVNLMSNVEIMFDEPQFTPDDPRYNPNSDMYNDSIYKI